MRSVGCSAASQATATVSRCCGGSSCGQGRSSSHCHRDWNPSCGTSPSTMGRAVPAADSPCCWCGGGAWSSTGGCCSVDVDGGGCGSTSVAELCAASVGRPGRQRHAARVPAEKAPEPLRRALVSTAKVWDHPSLGRRTSCRAPHHVRKAGLPTRAAERREMLWAQRVHGSARRLSCTLE